MAALGNEPETFRLVEQCLNQPHAPNKQFDSENEIAVLEASKMCKLLSVKATVCKVMAGHIGCISALAAESNHENAVCVVGQ